MTSRSWVDAITNDSLLAGLDAHEYRTWITNRSNDVNPVLPIFLHEFTHHWCFDSPVGTTLAGLYMRARERACLADLGEPEVASAVADDLIRYWAPSYLLHPLAEGLALFAEYDFYPGRERLLSPLYQAVLACFALPSRKADEYELVVRDTLQLARRTPHLCDRKADLLAKPATPEDSYLLGYLAVKALWNSARSRASRFEDPELFLAFVRNWFYLDAGLVNAILDPAVSGVYAANAIANRLRRRINDFLICDLDEAVTEWHAGAAMGDYGRFAGLQLGEIEIDRANTLLTPLLDTTLECGSGIADGAFAQAAKALRAYSLYRRDIFTMCEAGAQETILFTAGETTPSVWSTTNEEASEVAIWGNCSAELRSRLRAHAQYGELRCIIGQEMEKVFQEVVRRPAFDIWQWHLRESGRVVVSDIWEETALLCVPPDSRDRVSSQLRKRGILALLDGDVDTLVAIATIGVANTISTHRGAVQFVSRILGVDQEQIQRTEQQASSVDGMPLLAGQGDYLNALV